MEWVETSRLLGAFVGRLKPTATTMRPVNLFLTYSQTSIMQELDHGQELDRGQDPQCGSKMW